MLYPTKQIDFKNFDRLTKVKHTSQPEKFTFKAITDSWKFRLLSDQTNWQTKGGELLPAEEEGGKKL